MIYSLGIVKFKFVFSDLNIYFKLLETCTTNQLILSSSAGSFPLNKDSTVHNRLL